MIIAVQFNKNDRIYNYNCNEDVKVDDYVVVMGVNSIPTIAKVIDIDVVDNRINHSCIIQVVNLNEWQKQKALKLRKETLIREINKRKSEIEDKAIWELLASKDDKMKSLLEELNGLE